MSIIFLTCLAAAFVGSYSAVVVRDARLARMVRAAATALPSPVLSDAAGPHPFLSNLGQPFARPANAEEAARFIKDNPDLVDRILNPDKEDQ